MRLVLRLWRLPLPGFVRWGLVWLFNAKFIASVSAVVLNEAGEALLFLHTYRLDYPWALPGGWLQYGEDPALAIEREIMEESGLRVRVVRPLWVGRNHTLPSVDITFLACLEGGDFRPSLEVSEARYFPAGALPPLSAGSRALILKAVEERGT
jgi:8-oxo-dGTP diphosphatase